jgi:hypothetical protein
VPPRHGANRANQDIHAAVDRVERELQSFVQYLNDEVVPTVRQESTRALRTASNKLAKLADYLEEQKRKRA